MIFVAFALYGVGQTFYWPTVLGFTAEQFPKGGAMTLNTVSAMGLLTLGIFGMPFLYTLFCYGRFGRAITARRELNQFPANSQC